jgi:malate dehydrogenase
MFGGDEVVQAKAGGGSATLSMAAAGAKFAESIMIGMSGQPVRQDTAYVENPAAEKAYGTRFFASQIDLGVDGITNIHDTMHDASEYEKEKVEKMVGDLKNQINKGIKFAEQF